MNRLLLIRPQLGISLQHFYCPLTTNNLCSLRLIHTTSKDDYRWFAKGTLPRSKWTPQKDLPVFADDWEHERWKSFPPGKLLEGVESVKGFENASEEVKKIFTHEYALKKVEVDQQKLDLFRQLGIDLWDDGPAAKVIAYTIRIRRYKSCLEKDRNNIQRAITVRLIRTRQSYLRRLREIDLATFDRVTAALGIAYRHMDRYSFPTSVDYERKKQVREELYKIRKQKMTDYTRQLEEAKSEFYTAKQKELGQIQSQLAGLGLGVDSVFEQVVKERRGRLLQPVDDDKLAWFYEEKRLKAYYERRASEKAERKLKQQRKK